MTDCFSGDHYTVPTLQHLLLVKQLFNLITLLESTTTPLPLMLSCEKNQLLHYEINNISEPIYTVKQKQSIKNILTTQSENITVIFLQLTAEETLSNGFVSRDDQLSCSDLTTTSQEKLLEIAVKYEGSKTAIN
jgi:exonuclease I